MLWHSDDENNRNGRSIGHPFARIELMAVMLLSISLCAAVAGCGSSPASTPGSTLTPTPTPAPAPTPNPAPSVSSISPSAAPAGGLAFTLTVNGSNFINGSTVQWNGSSRTTTFVSGTQLQAHIMAADLASPGKATVTVVTSAPGGGTSGGATFTVAVNTIAFESVRALDGSNAANSTSNIWVVNPNGSGATPLTKLTASLAASFSPVWRSDGSKIAFASARALDGSNAANSTSNIWVVNPDGSGATPLTKLTASLTDSSNPGWSPDGSKILFTSARALDGSDAVSTNFTRNIWLINADGSGASPLTKLTAGGASSFNPVWSPDGSKIAFWSRRALDGSDSSNGVKNIWVMNADGSGATSVTKLTAVGADSSSPSWTPDSSKILFQSDRAVDGSNAATPQGTANIWVVNADGSGATPLTKLVSSPGALSAEPQASLDGSKIVFVSGRALDGSDASNSNGTLNIWVMNADGSSPAPLTKLTALNANNFTPIWSPGDTQIFFVSQRALDGGDAANTNNVFNIWAVNADGSGPTPLTRITAASANSSSPNQP